MSSRTPAAAGRAPPSRSARCAVQGSAAVTEVVRALAASTPTPEVDVIVIARGGGSVEDLLAFSNEALVRAVAGARTPVVSAIGHDIDTPLLDLVADVRASTPTHAAGLVVPDAAEMRAPLSRRRRACHRAIGDGCTASADRLVELRSRPVLTDPGAFARSQREVIATLRQRGQPRVEARHHPRAATASSTCGARRACSPRRRPSTAATPWCTQVDGEVVRDPDRGRGRRPAARRGWPRRLRGAHRWATAEDWTMVAIKTDGRDRRRPMAAEQPDVAPSAPSPTRTSTTSLRGGARRTGLDRGPARERSGRARGVDDPVGARRGPRSALRDVARPGRGALNTPS